MNKIFLSKDNTSNLYKEILKENNLQALPRKSKEIIVNNLVENMKEVYRHLDQSKINRNNYNAILNQFNSMCINETSKNLKNSQIFSGEDNQVSRIKFARDFNSTPKKQVKFLERPKSTLNSYTNRSDNSSDNSVINSTGFKNSIKKASNSLDNMFQPITNTNFSDSNFGYINNSDSINKSNAKV